MLSKLYEIIKDACRSRLDKVRIVRDTFLVRSLNDVLKHEDDNNDPAAYFCKLEALRILSEITDHDELYNNFVLLSEQKLKARYVDE